MRPFDRRRAAPPGAHRRDLRSTTQQRHQRRDGRGPVPLMFNAARVMLVYEAAEGRPVEGESAAQGCATLLMYAATYALCPADARPWFMHEIPQEARAALRWLITGDAGDTRMDTSGRPPAPVCADGTHADRALYARSHCAPCYRKLSLAGLPLDVDARTLANPRRGLAELVAGVDAIVSRGGRSVRQVRARIRDMPPARAFAVLLLVRPETREHIARSNPGVWVEGADGRVMELRRRPSAESDDS